MQPRILLLVFAAVRIAANPNAPGNPCKCPHPSAQAGRDCDPASSRTVHAEAPMVGTAAEIRDQFWTKIDEVKQRPGFMSPLKTLWNIRNISYLESMAYEWNDDRGESHRKVTHGVGAAAQVHFEWCANPYSGLFQKADACIARISNAAKPATAGFNPTSYGPNVGIKCFRDQNAFGSGDIISIWEIDGYDVIPQGKQSSCSFFETPVSNHCGDRDNITSNLRKYFLPKFEQVDINWNMVGLSKFARAAENGTLNNYQFPFALVLDPHPDLNKVPCSFADFTSQLKNIGLEWLGKPIYKVYAVHDPWYSRPKGAPDIRYLGELVLDTTFLDSFFGDTALAFQHVFQKDEMDNLGIDESDRAAQWRKYVDPQNPGKFNKVEGAAWYQPFLPAWNSSVCARDLA